MTRPGLMRAAACLATGLLSAAALVLTPTSAHAAEDDAEDATPLEVTIAQVTPSTLPLPRETRPVTIRGTVTNVSEEDWTGLNAYPLTSVSPIRSQAELVEANASDPTSVIGDRLIEEDQYDELPDLAPGESASYDLTITRDDLQIDGSRGVYWLGVHVLGANDDGQDTVADGRARTFIPLMRPDGPQGTLSLVVPLKGAVQRDADGRLVRADDLAASFAKDGRLGSLLRLSRRTDVAFTWVIDPSLVDAAQSIVDGNPPRQAGPSLDGSGDGPTTAPSDPDASDDPSPGSAAGDGETDAGPTDDTSPEGDATEGDETEEGDATAPRAKPTPAQRAAARWLQELRRQSEEHAVMAVPYGDLDVAATLGRNYRIFFRQAVALSAQTMADLGIDAEPIIAPTSGYLSGDALARIDDTAAVLLSGSAFPEADDSVLGPYLPGDVGDDGDLVGDGTTEGAPIVLTDPVAGSGGPAPGRAVAPIAFRQRLLSEAALHALSNRSGPLVVSTPMYWHPGPNTARFFNGLEVPWLTTMDLRGVISTNDTSNATTDRVNYPTQEREREIPFQNLFASRGLSQDGEVLAGLLARNDTIDEQAGKQAMLGSSGHARRSPLRAANFVRQASEAITSMLGQVHVDGPSFVTLSSDSGTFAVTIVNDLDEPVDVAVTADTGSSPVTIQSSDPITLGPGERESVRLQANSEDIGVYSASLVPVNGRGQPLGSVTRFSVRSSQVGLVIWVIMGLGGVVLLAAIVVRVLRRVSRRRKTHGPRLDPERTP